MEKGKALTYVLSLLENAKTEECREYILSREEMIILNNYIDFLLKRLMEG